MSEERIIVSIPCHFKNKSELCETTRQRLDRALILYRALCQADADVIFIVTGNVPYEPGSPSLAYLQKRHLMERGVSEKKIFIGEGVGMFSEAESVAGAIKRFWPEPARVYIHSSDWYFWPGRAIWKEAARRWSLPMASVPIRKTGGLRTKAIYAAYGLIFWAAGIMDKILVPFLRQSVFYLLGELLTKLQSGRKNGFKMNGCA